MRHTVPRAVGHTYTATLRDVQSRAKARCEEGMLLATIQMGTDRTSTTFESRTRRSSISISSFRARRQRASEHPQHPVHTVYSAQYTPPSEHRTGKEEQAAGRWLSSEHGGQAEQVGSRWSREQRKGRRRRVGCPRGRIGGQEARR